MAEQEWNNLIELGIGFIIISWIILAVIQKIFKIQVFDKIIGFVFIIFIFINIISIYGRYNIRKTTYGIKTKSFLNETTKDTKVYIDKLEIINSQYIIEQLKKVTPEFMPHRHSNYTYEPTKHSILIVNKDKNRTIELIQDSEWKKQYKVYSDKEFLGVTETIFDELIKIKSVKNGNEKIVIIKFY